jgi:hypothetical protein
MVDIDLIPTELAIQMRDRERQIDWSKMMKDAWKKAAKTRRHQAAGRKAAETRKQKIIT